MGEFIITRDDNTPKSELKHWKYIKREKSKNGKWRYYYDTTELNRFKNKSTVESVEYPDGESASEERTTKYKKSNKLFDSQKTSYPMDGYTDITLYQGKISRAQAKGEKWIYNTFLKKNATIKKPISVINKGQKLIPKTLKNK